jgi:hypothetical protein
MNLKREAISVSLFYALFFKNLGIENNPFLIHDDPIV